MTLVEHGTLQDHVAPVDGGGSIGTGDIAHCGRGLEHLPGRTDAGGGTVWIQGQTRLGQEAKIGVWVRVVVQVQAAEVEGERLGELAGQPRVLGRDGTDDAEVGETVDAQQPFAFGRLALVGDRGLVLAAGDLVLEPLVLLLSRD
jgi:hypothetical protein